jgi:hypothetical protein
MTHRIDWSRAILLAIPLVLVAFIFYYLMAPSKVIIGEKIQGHSGYCEYPRTDANSDCGCQEGYARVNRLRYSDCHPELCTHIKTVTMLGDVGADETYLCVNGLHVKNYTYCDSVSNSWERDMCYLAYVGLTNETYLCSQISDFRMRWNCLG